MSKPLVHRNGIPPKKLRYKVVIEFDDWQFNEDKIVAWLRENVTSQVQYDTITFESPHRFKKTIQLTVWFQLKADKELFSEAWVE